MTFTFEHDYEVFTSSDARRALELLDEHAPVAVVLSDQRMPNMSGVEFLKEVWQRHPSTVRMILTGFADMEAIIEAINDGHVYSYITKPWEPDHLKQVMKQATDHYALTVENERLLTHLQHANVYLEAVMDQLDTGALAVDADGVIQAINRPARDYLALDGDPRGASLKEVLHRHGLDEIDSAVERLHGDAAAAYEEVDVTVADRAYRVRVALHTLSDNAGDTFGRVVLFREISHEPLRRRFEQVLSRIVEAENELRPVLEEARSELLSVADEVGGLHVDSGGVGELKERISRTLTAVDNWLDVDDAMAREAYPEAQMLLDRMRLARVRWPLKDRLPARVKQLGECVEAYYESGENPKRPVL
jgi:CheY-like chemotaxis protein